MPIVTVRSRLLHRSHARVIAIASALLVLPILLTPQALGASGPRTADAVKSVMDTSTYVGFA